jgi:ABC-type dipeptide/oligopeptide/nickel transport system permease subunit
MSDEQTVPAMRAGKPDRRDHPLTRSVAGMIGMGVLAVLVLACVGTLPWTLSAAGPGLPVRYDDQNLAANRLPPGWMIDLPETWADPNLWSGPEAELRDPVVAGFHAAARQHAIRAIERRRDREQAAAAPAAPDATGDAAGPPPIEPAAEQIRQHAPLIPFGTDNLGRDVFIRSLAGGGVSIGIGLAAAGISVLIGTLYGAIAGYVGGKTDAILMRVVDVLYGLPYILLVVLLAVAGDALVERYDAHLKRSSAETRWQWVLEEAAERSPVGGPAAVETLPAQALVPMPDPEADDPLDQPESEVVEQTNAAIRAYAVEPNDPRLRRSAVRRISAADPDFAAAEGLLLWLSEGDADSASEVKADATRQGYRVEGLSPGAVTALEVLVLLLAIGGVSWLTMARVIRGQVLSLKARPFMEASRAMGVPVWAQFARHLLPNLIGPIVVYATLTVPQAVLQESFLSFLGIGVQQPLPSWGNLAAQGLNELNTVTSRWWLLVFPCVLLGVTLLALNFVGEGLREAFDPKRARK